MKTNLIIVEGLPGSGKSTTAAMIAKELAITVQSHSLYGIRKKLWQR